MQYLKVSWEKGRKTDVPVKVLEHIAAHGSFVVVKSKMLYRDFNEPAGKPAETPTQDLSLAELVNQKVRDVNLRLWMENLADNIETIKTEGDVSLIPKARKKTAIIVAAGPSFQKNNHLEILKKANNHVIISTDRMLVRLLEAGIIPDFVVSVDGHRQAILSFYDNKLVNKHLTTIGVMAVTIAQNVVQRFQGKKFFFTPMIDDMEQPASLTAALGMMTRTSILATGGNVGITSIYLASYLGFRNIILTGIDLGYTPETPVENSAYFQVVKEVDPTITPEKYREQYVIEGYNPDFKTAFYTDITWKSHIDALIKQSRHISDGGVSIVNSTEGGAVYGGAIKCLPLKEALTRYE